MCTLTPRNLVAMWQVLTGDAQLIEKVFVHLLEVLFLSLPYQEKTKGNRTIRLETDTPKAVSLLHFQIEGDLKFLPAFR